jgi:hypothetical protein
MNWAGLGRRFILLGFALLISFYCGRRSSEEIIRDMLDEAAVCAEKKDIAGVLGFLSENYGDGEGRNKEQTRQLLQEYFRSFQGIVIHALSTRWLELDEQHALVQLDVALSSGAAEVFRKLVRFSGEFYRFTCRIEPQEKRWLISNASWEFIGMEELLPESLQILKELFPDFN